jgi:hypothetical protein
MAGEFLGSFSKFFTNLTKSQRQELDRAFADLQNMKEMTSLDESIRLLKRKPDQALPIPQLKYTESIRGAIIEWPALQDQRINFYEANVSTFSNFSTFTIITTFGTDLVLEGLQSAKYVRVRGVRRDGTTTPYSSTLTVTASLFEVKAYTAESFYTTLEVNTAHVLLGGVGTTLQYTPINADGNSMVWGFLSGYANPACAFFGNGKIQASVWVAIYNAGGALISDTEYERVTFGEHYNSLNIGPFPISHPDPGATIAIRMVAWDLTTTETGGDRGKNPTMIEWCHLNVLEVGIGEAFNG